MTEDRFEGIKHILSIQKWLKEQAKGKLPVFTLQSTALNLYKIIEFTEMCENIRTIRGGKTFLQKATSECKRTLKEAGIKSPTLEELKQIAQIKD